MRLRTAFAVLSKLLERWQYFCWGDRGHLPTARKCCRQHETSPQQQQDNSSLWRAATFDFRWEWCDCERCGGAFAGFPYLCCCSAYRCVSSSSSSRAVKRLLKTLNWRWQRVTLAIQQIPTSFPLKQGGELQLRTQRVESVVLTVGFPR